MSLKVTIYAPGKKTRKGEPDRTVDEVIDGIAKRVKEEAAELAKAGYTVDGDSVRLSQSFGSYDVTMEASR